MPTCPTCGQLLHMDMCPTHGSLMRIGPPKEPEPTLEELGRRAEIDLALAAEQKQVKPPEPSRGIRVVDLINKK